MGEPDHDAPTLVCIIGPPAVGKMTVGQALARLTGFRLFHLHQVIDLITEYFEYGSPAYLRLVPSFRAQLFEEAAGSGLSLITTGAWRFDDPSEAETFQRYAQTYRERRGRALFVELVAPLAVRIDRNLTENRRRHKKTDWSTTEHLKRDASLHQYDSGGSLPLDLPLLRIDTEHLSAEVTAERIRGRYDLPLMPG